MEGENDLQTKEELVTPRKQFKITKGVQKKTSIKGKYSEVSYRKNPSMKSLERKRTKVPEKRSTAKLKNKKDIQCPPEDP